MASNIKRFFTGIQLVGLSSPTPDQAGEVQYDSSLNKLVMYNASSVSSLVTETHTATLTNKTISIANNTLTGVAPIDSPSFTGLVTIGAPASTTTHVINGLLAQTVSSTSTNIISFANSSGTSAAHTRIRIMSEESTGGDPYLSWTINGINSMSMGRDNSDSDALVITAATTLNGTNLFRMATNGDTDFTSTTAATSTTTGALKIAGGLGVGGQGWFGDIINSRKDQDASSRSIFRNFNAGSSASARVVLSTNADDLEVNATSVAAGASTSLNSGAGFTGGFAINQAGAFPVKIRTNGVERFSISGAGLITLGDAGSGQTHVMNGTLSVTNSAGPELQLVDGGTAGLNADPYLELRDNSSSMMAVGYLSGEGSVDASIINRKNGSLIFGTNNTAHVSISNAGITNFNSTTGSTSATTGAVTIAGGLGVAESLHTAKWGLYDNTGPNLQAKIGAGGTSYIFQNASNGSMNISGGSGSGSGRNMILYGSSHASANNLQIRRGTTVDLTIDNSGIISMLSNVASTSTTTGSLVVTGGIGASGTVTAARGNFGAGPYGGSGVVGLPNNNGISWRDASNTTNYHLYLDSSDNFILPKEFRMTNNVPSLVRSILTNANTNSAAKIQLSLTSNAGDFDITSTSIAGGAAVTLSSGSSYTGGLTLNQLGSNPISFKTNGVERLNLSGAGVSRFTGTIEAFNQTPVRFYEGSSGSDYIAFQAPASVAAPVTFTLPATDGTTDQVLKTNGSGALGWATVTIDSIDTGELILHTPGVGAAGHGTSSTKIRRFGTIQKNTATSLTYADSASLGMSVTVNETGLYAIDYVDSYNSASFSFGISVNSSQQSTSIGSITDTNRIGFTASTTSMSPHCSIVIRLQINDVIRAHTDGTPNTFTALARFSMRKVGK